MITAATAPQAHLLAPRPGHLECSHRGKVASCITPDRSTAVAATIWQGAGPERARSMTRENADHGPSLPTLSGPPHLRLSSLDGAADGRSRSCRTARASRGSRVGDSHDTRRKHEAPGSRVNRPSKRLPGNPMEDHMRPIDRCAVPRCSNRGDIIYLGKPVCMYHWDRYTAEGQPEDALKRKLSLDREPTAVALLILMAVCCQWAAWMAL